MDTNVETNAPTTPATRGRKKGQKVASLDYRAHVLLEDANLAQFYTRDDIGTRKWERDVIAHIMGALRDGDDPIF